MTVAAAALLAVPATPALASWSAPVVVSPAGENSIDPHVALNERGDAVVVWRHRISDYLSTVEFISRVGGSAFAPPVVVSPGQQSGFDPHAWVGSDGEAVVAWSEHSPSGDRVRVAAGRAGQDFGPPVTVGADSGSMGTHDLCIGGDRTGDVTLFWTQQDSALVHFATRPAGGEFGPPSTIPNPGTRVERPRCAVAANGDALATWTSAAGVSAAIRPAGAATFTSRVVGGLGGAHAFGAHPAVNASGAAIVAWVEANEGWTAFYNKAAWRPAGGAFGPPEVINPVTGTVPAPYPAIDANGTATLLGVQGEYLNPSYSGIGTVERAPDGRYVRYDEVSQEGWEEDPVVDFDAGDNLFMAWRRYYDRSAPYGVAYAATRAAGASFAGPVTPLSAEGRNVWPVALAAGAPGNAIAVWPRGTFPADFRIELSEFGSAVGPETPASEGEVSSGGSAPTAAEVAGGETAGPDSPAEPDAADLSEPGDLVGPTLTVHVLGRPRPVRRRRLRVALRASEPVTASLRLLTRNRRPIAHAIRNVGGDRRRVVALRIGSRAAARLRRTGTLPCRLEVVARDHAANTTRLRRAIVLRSR